jgi:LmbE family N-acetylglucosaminyl deacetylase
VREPKAAGHATRLFAALAALGILPQSSNGCRRKPAPPFSLRVTAMRSRACPVLLVSLLTLGLVTAAHAQDSNRTLMAIFAHPDDEVFVAPLLARYARNGHDVYLVIATDGQKGVREHAGIPPGEALATARAEEARCAADRLGIHPPILLGYEDAGLASFASLQGLRDDIARVLREHRPAAIITFGPDGATGHPDHRLVSNVVTEIVQSGAETGDLYFVSLPAERAAAIPRPLPVRVTAERYLTARVPFESRDMQAARESFACHASQFTEEEREGIFQLLDQVLAGRIYLRPWRGSDQLQEDLLP